MNNDGAGETTTTADMKRMWTDMLANWGASFAARWEPRRPRSVAPSRAGGEAPLQYREWEPLVRRFADDRGVDYRTFQRARRVLEAHLDRLSDARPGAWNDADAELAFYLNAYNAIAIHQVLLHYPVGSIRDIRAAFARPYPVGPENLTLYQLLYGKIRRFGDPRALAAVVPAARGGPDLRIYTTPGLHTELDEQLRAYLARTTRVNVQGLTAYLTLPALVRRFAPDFAAPGQAPRLLDSVQARFDPANTLPYLRPFLPDDARARLDGHQIMIAWRTYDWTLNER